MVQLSTSPKTAAVLEPSSGQGVFLDALLAAGFVDVHGVEIDPALATHATVPVQCGSFLKFSPARKYDLVIGNPPYIRWKDLPEEGRQEMRDHALYGELFNSLSDYLTAFVAASVELLNDGGELIFITPSFWMYTLHSEPLRNWLMDHGTITDVIEFGEATVFPKVASAIVIFRFVKAHKNETSVAHHLYLGPRKVPTTELYLDDATLFDSRPIRPFLRGSHWTLATDDELVPVEALEKACSVLTGDLFATPSLVRLGQFVQIANGMVSGLDKAFQIPTNVEELLSVEELNATLRVSKARQLSNYVALSSMRYVNIPQGLSSDQVNERFPNLIQLLDPFREELAERYSYGRDLPFWEWAFRRSESFLLNGEPKGFVPCKERITSRARVRFALVESDVVAVQDVTAFAPLPGIRESLEYVVAFLNHPWVSKWIARKGLVKGGVAEFSEKPLSEVPFRRIDWESSDETRIHEEIKSLMNEFSKASEEDRPTLDVEIVAKVEELLLRTA